MDSNQEELDELEKVLAGKAEDMDSQELEDFMTAVDEMDDPQSVEDILAKDESSFMKTDTEPYIKEDGDVPELFDSAEEEKNAGNDKKTLGASGSISDLDEEKELADIVSSFTEFGDEEHPAGETSGQDNVNERLTLTQRLKAFFKKKELTEEQKLQIEQEEEQERQLEKQHKEKKAAAKKIKAEKKQAQKAEKQAKKREKKAAMNQKKAVKQEAKQKKLQAKRAEPQLPKVSVKPLVFIMIIGLSLVCFFVLSVNIKFYNTSIESAKTSFVHQQYDNAYSDLLGLRLKKEDQELFKQAKTVRMLDIKEEAYGQYISMKKYPEALKALIAAVEKYEIYKDDAVKLGVSKEFDSIYANIEKELSNKFAVSIDEAKKVYEMTDKEAFNQRINELAETAALKDSTVKEAQVQQVQN